jgi:hypothetical protein
MIEITDKVIEEEITKAAMIEMIEEAEVEIVTMIDEEMIAEATAVEVEIERKNKKEEVPLHHLPAEAVDLMKYKPK